MGLVGFIGIPIQRKRHEKEDQTVAPRKISIMFSWENIEAN